MALVLPDRVRETSTSTGTGTVTLAGAVFGFQSFSAVGNGNSTYYCIVNQSADEWEVGIGTYTASGTTLSRTTVLSSSNAGSLVSFSAGTKDVFVTYPAERGVWRDTADTYVVQDSFDSLTANSATLTTGTISTTPSGSTDLVNKQYVDTIAVQGTYYHAPVKYETASALTASYNNGSSGVGATLTNTGTLAAFTPDGVVASVGDRILVYKQSNQTQNGVYTVTTVGDGSTAWVLTRATDADTYGLINANALGQGDAFFVQAGNTGAGETYVCNTVGTITFGTTNITFVQISDTQVYSAGTGLTLSGTQFSITNTGVTATTYGSASQVPVLAVNAQGQITSVTDTSIAISSGAVSGLAASATIDTTNASNISSGTLGTLRLNGSYTGITGVGMLTVGAWAASTIDAAYGGTGISSYTTGDLIYANTSTSFAKLSDVATGNVLISGGVSTAPSWGKVGLTTHVSGTLPVSSGGTGATTLTGYVKGNGTSALTASATIPNSDTTATNANTANAIVARDASGNFSAGVITATLAGTANYATSAGSATVATYVGSGVTFNNGGAGDASGTFFDGSAPKTVSYNTIGAPSTTGTNASGTWNISISGNAATATSATSATSATTATTVTRGAGGIATVQAPGSGTYNFHYMYADATEFYLEAALATDSVSGTKLPITFTWRGGYATQGGLTITGPSAAALGGNTILHAGNYNTYAPTLTGGGASGTWGISISGNAATATTATNVASNAALTTPTITGTREVRVAVGASNLDLATGNYFSKTISGTTTFTVSNVPTTGTAQSLILDLTNGGSATINWWSGMKWPGGTAPTLTASGRDVLGFFTYDGGTTWTGLILGKDVK